MPANYDQPTDVVKRVRFFDGQFLKDQDFIDDQKYHIDRQRRPNRILRVSGICEGLTLTVSNNQVKVNPGTALDSQGRSIVLSGDPFAVDLKDLTGAIDIFISYADEESDITQPGNERTTAGASASSTTAGNATTGTATTATLQGAKGATRWLEKPRIEAVGGQSTPQGSNPIWLGRVTVSGTGSGRSVALTTMDDRQYSGIYLPSSANAFEAPVLRSGGNLNPKLAVLTGDLRIRGTTANSTAAGLNVTDAVNKSLLYVRNDGNVSIGTADPGNFKLSIGGTGGEGTLHIASDFKLGNANRLNLIRFGSNSGNDGDYQMLYQASGAFERKTLGIHVHTDHAFGVYSSNWTLLWGVKGGGGDIYAKGNLSLGNTAGGGSRLLLTSWKNSHYIRASDWWTEFVSHPNQGWKFISLGGDTDEAAATPQERMRVTSSGNVGIGTAAPDAKLHIAGTISTTSIETAELIRLLRPAVTRVKNSNSAGIFVGAFETGINGRTRMDLKLSGTPNNGNAWGTIPDATVMTLQADGNVTVAGIMTATKLIGEGAVVTGMILMWSGSVENIPLGWALCNGQNKTPNLSGRFILGGSASYGYGTTGGEANVTLTTDHLPAHDHKFDDSFKHILAVGTGTIRDSIDNAGATEPRLTDSKPLQTVGKNVAHNNMPPYYVLAYIMKT